jgi:CRP-like cAMP-binding protein
MIPQIFKQDTPIEKIPGEFIKLANESGGKDNITTIVVRIADHDGRATLLHEEINKKIETIQKMPIFKFLTYKELVRILNITQVVNTTQNQRIITEGETGEELYIILSGKVKVHKGNTDIVTLGEGDHFGEMALIDKVPRSASISAIEQGKLLKISRTDFFDIIRNEPRLATKLLWSFLQVISERLRTTSAELSGAKNEQIEDLTEELFDLSITEDNN